MRDPKRIEIIIEQLRAVWLLEPDLRLGQLVFNASRLSEQDQEIFHIEDDRLAAGLSKYLTLISNRQSQRD
jgi:hypothetical protein